MRTVKGDLFTYNPRSTSLEKTPDNLDELLGFKPSHGKVLRCVTTNGVVNRYGSLVMGAGVAKYAKRRWKELPHILGQKVDERGNHVYVVEKYGAASFPTKHHWKNPSDINLIARSCRELATVAKHWDYVLLPKPGCGLGKLIWEEVEPVLDLYLNHDKYIIVHP